VLQLPVRMAFAAVVALLLAGTLVFAAVRSDGERGPVRERERGGRAEIPSAMAAPSGPAFLAASLRPRTPGRLRTGGTPRRSTRRPRCSRRNQRDG